MKAFIPYHVTGKVTFNPTVSENEPQGTQWRAFGVRKANTLYPDEEQLAHQDQDSEFVDVVITERVLPSNAIKRAVREMATKHFEQTGERATKILNAQWKEQYIADNLPNAPLKETVVRVALYNDYLLIGTSSAKLADDLMQFVRSYVIDQYDPETMIIKTCDFTQMPLWLYNTFIEHGWGSIDIGQNIKLFDPETTRKVSVNKDYDLSQAVNLIDANREVIEIQLEVTDNVTFSVNDKGIFKGIKIHKNMEREAELNEASHDKVNLVRANWIFMKDALSKMLTIIEQVEKDNEL